MVRLFIALVAMLLVSTDGFGQVSIGSPVPHPSAQLDVSSSSKGFLPPRMTFAERNAIVNPAPGLMIFNTTTQNLEIFTPQGGWFQIANQNNLKNLLGSSRIDEVASIVPTNDGGFILAGNSDCRFPDGDITTPGHGGAINFTDYWIVKLDALKNIEWNMLYGGNQDDKATSILQTNDGGFIVAGISNSSANGDIIGTNHGSNDWWVLKLDKTGKITWSRLYGGISSETDVDILQAEDGGYILSGTSVSSATGDVSGTNNGGTDYWIVKINAEGGILWERLFGGSGNDVCSDLTLTDDGGYIIAGSSFSSQTGNVTGTNHGLRDYWVIKLSGDGVIIWEKLLGSTFTDICTSITATKDGGCVVTGYSNSSASGDVTGTNHDIPGGTSYDYWIIRLNDKGNTVWNHLIGAVQNPAAHASQIEMATGIVASGDGGFIIAGQTASTTNGDIRDINRGGLDFFIVKVDGNGMLVWSRLYGGNSSEFCSSIAQIPGGGFVIAGHTQSSESGHVKGLNHGLTDIWVINLDKDGNMY
jgi:hypothetical protein